MQDQCVRKIPVGVSCSRLGEEDDPCAGRIALYLTRFEAETTRMAWGDVCGCEGEYAGWVREAGWKLDQDRETEKPMTLCKSLAHVMILPEIPPFRGPMDRLKKTSLLKFVILAPPS